MKKYLIGAGVALFPLLALAQTSAESLITKLASALNLLLPIVFALAVLVFFWGLVVYIFNAANEEKKAEGRRLMIWGIIALFVMFSVYGILRVLQATFLEGTSQAPIPIPGYPQ